MDLAKAYSLGYKTADADWMLASYVSGINSLGGRVCLEIAGPLGVAIRSNLLARRNIPSPATFRVDRGRTVCDSLSQVP